MIQDFCNVFVQLWNLASHLDNMERTVDFIKSVVEVYYGKRESARELVHTLKDFKEKYAARRREDLHGVLSLGKIVIDKDNEARERRRADITRMTGGVDYLKPPNLKEFEENMKRLTRPVSRF